MRVSSRSFSTAAVIARLGRGEGRAGDSTNLTRSGASAGSIAAWNEGDLISNGAMPWLQVITLSWGRPRARAVDPVEKLHGPRLPSAPPWVRPLRRIIDTDLDGIDGAFRHLSIGLRGEPGADHWLAGAVCAAGQTTQAHRPPVRGCRAAIHSVDRAFYDALSRRASP